MLIVVLVFHIIAAVSVGPILLLPFLVRTPALLTALRFLRIGAIGTLVTGITLWSLLHLGHPAWLIVSALLYIALCVVIALVIEPAAQHTSDDRSVRLLGGSLVSCALTLAIIVLMVLRPGEA